MPLLNPLKQKIKSGQPIFGVMATIPSIQVVQILAHAGFDYIKIDLEHGPVSIESAHSMVVATAGTPTIPVARVPWNLPWIVKTLLDVGVMGICFPWIHNAEEASLAASSVRYPPVGQRGWGPFFTHIRWDVTMADYIKMADDEIITEILIERADAIDNLEEIISTPGVDTAFIAPNDLAASLGLKGQPDHPTVKSYIERAEKIILNSNVTLGGFPISPDRINPMLDRGYKVITVSFDFILLKNSAKQILDSINR